MINLQNMINNMNEIMKERSGKEYNLGMLINDLEKYKDSDMVIKLDTGFYPKNFDSWRGSYCELSLTYDLKEKTLAKDLYLEAVESDGETFEGYKGGEFTMNKKTPIHQANYGEWHLYKTIKGEERDLGTRKIVGIKENNGKIIIITRNDEDE